MTENLSKIEYNQLRSVLGNRDFRMNNLYHILDKYDKQIIFKQRPVQKYLDLGRWYLNMILKSRQHGMTTGELIVMLDKTLFMNNVRCGMTCDTQDNAERLFQKVIFAYKKLPDILKDAIKPTKETGSIMRFNNGSSIEVSVSFLSGSLSHLHISEMGKICQKQPEKAMEIVKGSLNAVAPGCFITIEATARGRSGWFYEQCQRALNNKRRGVKLSTLDYKFFFFGWLENPDDELDPEGVQIYPEENEYFDKKEKELGVIIPIRKRAFYSKKKETQGEGMYSEYPTTPDEAFMKILEGTYYGGLMAKAREEKRITEVPYQSAYKVNTAWDLGINDETAIWFWQEIGLKLLLIDYIEDKDKLLKDYVNMLRDYSAEKGYQYGVHLLPHDASVRETHATGLTKQQYLEKVGISPTIMVPKLGRADGIEVVRETLPNCWFDLSCDEGITALEEYRKVWDKRLGSYKNEPLHSKESNGADAIRTLCVYFKYKQVRQFAKKSRYHKERERKSAGGWS